MCLKVDLSKAFDSVRWNFIKDAPVAMHFPAKMINWILECVIDPAFSIPINENPCGFSMAG